MLDKQGNKDLKLQGQYSSLFYSLADSTYGNLTRYLYFFSTELEEFPRVLYVKPSNK